MNTEIQKWATAKFPKPMTGGSLSESTGSAPSKPVAAQWTVNLHADCPLCKEWVDLLEYPDFWDRRELEIAEHGTERSRCVEVVCPECGGEFEVECEY